MVVGSWRDRESKPLLQGDGGKSEKFFSDYVNFLNEIRRAEAMNENGWFIFAYFFFFYVGKVSNTTNPGFLEFLCHLVDGRQTPRLMK